MTRGWIALLALACSCHVAAKTLTVCTEANPDGFDYALFHANSTADASSEALYNRLVEFEPGTTRLVPGLAERLPTAIAPHCFSDGFRTPVRRAVHGDSGGVRGAAWLFATFQP